VLDNTVKHATRAKFDRRRHDGGRRSRRLAVPDPEERQRGHSQHDRALQGVSIIVPKYSAYNVNSAGQLVLSAQGIWTTEFPYYDRLE
jgi:hypothetical protein